MDKPSPLDRVLRAAVDIWLDENFGGIPGGTENQTVALVNFEGHVERAFAHVWRSRS